MSQTFIFHSKQLIIQNFLTLIFSILFFATRTFFFAVFLLLDIHWKHNPLWRDIVLQSLSVFRSQCFDEIISICKIQANYLFITNVSHIITIYIFSSKMKMLLKQRVLKRNFLILLRSILTILALCWLLVISL